MEKTLLLTLVARAQLSRVSVAVTSTISRNGPNLLSACSKVNAASHFTQKLVHQSCVLELEFTSKKSRWICIKHVFLVVFCIVPGLAY